MDKFQEKESQQAPPAENNQEQELPAESGREEEEQKRDNQTLLSAKRDLEITAIKKDLAEGKISQEETQHHISQVKVEYYLQLAEKAMPEGKKTASGFKESLRESISDPVVMALLQKEMGIATAEGVQEQVDRLEGALNEAMDDLADKLSGLLRDLGQDEQALKDALSRALGEELTPELLEQVDIRDPEKTKVLLKQHLPLERVLEVMIEEEEETKTPTTLEEDTTEGSEKTTYAEAKNRTAAQKVVDAVARFTADHTYGGKSSLSDFIDAFFLGAEPRGYRANSEWAETNKTLVEQGKQIDEKKAKESLGGGEEERVERFFGAILEEFRSTTGKAEIGYGEKKIRIEELVNSDSLLKDLKKQENVEAIRGLFLGMDGFEIKKITTVWLKGKDSKLDDLWKKNLPIDGSGITQEALYYFLSRLQ